MNVFKNKAFQVFLVKFVLVFCLLYFGTIALIGVSAPGNYYSPFIQQHLDYVTWLRRILLTGSKALLSLFGVDTYSTNDFRLRMQGGRGVILAYDCLGYGVMSFWIAYVFASAGRAIKKTAWIVAGILLIYLINISRISLFLLAVNREWKMPLGIDHHTWFNIVAYLAIFMMMYFFERSGKRKLANNRDEVKE